MSRKLDLCLSMCLVPEKDRYDKLLVFTRCDTCICVTA